MILQSWKSEKCDQQGSFNIGYVEKCVFAWNVWLLEIAFIIFIIALLKLKIYTIDVDS